MSLKIFSSGINFKLVSNSVAADKESKVNSSKSENNYKSVGLTSRYNDHLLAFKARVDKGLERFYNANKDRMPVTVRRYVENLEDKTRLTPLEAQRRAFEKLQTAQTVEDIKKAYSDDKLFEKLINPEKSKATRGIIMSIKENKELLDLSGESALKNNENFTVYLVKKVFLEAKTVDEINRDLENDLNDDFKADFKFKNPNSTYIHYSTLKALGIETPEPEYQQSLRYTRDGYADTVGQKISQGQKAFWESLDMNERTERAKKSVENFENWWNSLSQNEKLDMIADQLNELEMLKLFKKYKRTVEKEQKISDTENPDDVKTQKTSQKNKVGSKKLNQDELFKKWAANNLKIFEESLSEAQKDSLHIKRMQRLSARWKEMTPAEKTNYISKMKAGSEPLRFTMIDAWNHSQNLIKALSLHLKQNQIYKPADLLYSTQEFSQFQSQVMTEFWEKNPDFSVELGQNIIKSQEKIKAAIQRGTFEELKKQIMRDKNQRVKEIEKYKAANTQSASSNSQETQGLEPDYKKEFKKAYDSHIYGKLKSIPKNYYNDLYEDLLNSLPENVIRLWTENLNGKELSDDELAFLKQYIGKETPKSARCNRAIEAAMADTLFEFTKDPEVYTMSNSDVKTAMYHLERGEQPIVLDSHKVGKRYVLNILKKGKVDANRVNALYETYKKDLTEDEVNYIFSNYFTIDKDNIIGYIDELKNNNLDDLLQTKQEILDYIKSYGRSALILFSEKSAYPVKVKDAFNRKFLANMPDEFKNNCCLRPSLITYDDIEQEQKIIRAKYLWGKRFSFLPQDVINTYFKNVAIHLRNLKSSDTLEAYIEEMCTKRKNIKANAKVAIIEKSDLSDNDKLNFLAMEEAMADVLYDATGNLEVYSLEFENLCDNLELFSMATKFPTETRTYTPAQHDSEMTIAAKKKPNLGQLKQLYKEYLEELQDWEKENEQISKDEVNTELLYRLNPEEDNPLKDYYVAQRMAKYNFQVEKITIPAGTPFDKLPDFMK